MFEQILIFTMFLVLGIVFAGISKIVFKTYINPVNVYNVIWCTCSALASLSVWGSYPITIETAILIAIGIIAFSSTCLIIEQANKSRIRNKLIPIVEIDKINTKIFYIIHLLAWGYLLPYTLKAINIIRSSGLETLKYYIVNANTDHTMFTTRQFLVCAWFVFPVFYATIVLTAYTIASGKIKRYIVIVGIIDMLLYVVTVAGRIVVFNFIIFCVLAYLFNLNRKKIVIPRKYKLVVLALILLLVYVTSQRRVGELTVIQNVYFYFVGAIIYFNIIINKWSMFAIPTGYTLGKATFGFLTTPIEIIYSIISKVDYKGIDNVISSFSGQYYEVAPSVSLNHASTMLYPMIADFGKVGVVVGPIFFAIGIMMVYIKSRNSSKNYLMWQCLSLYLLYAVFFSEWEHVLMWPQSFSIIVLIIIFTHKYRIKISNN